MAEVKADEIKRTMSEEQHARAVKWMEGKAPGIKCEGCGTEGFMILRDFVSPPVITEDGAPGNTGRFIPCFMVMCRTCGNMKMFNAVKSGVLEPDTEKAQESPAPTRMEGPGKEDK